MKYKLKKQLLNTKLQQIKTITANVLLYEKPEELVKILLILLGRTKNKFITHEKSKGEMSKWGPVSQWPIKSVPNVYLFITTSGLFFTIRAMVN